MLILVLCGLYEDLSDGLIDLPSVVTLVKSEKQSCSFTYLGTVRLPSIRTFLAASIAVSLGLPGLLNLDLPLANQPPVAFLTKLSTVALSSPDISTKLAINEASACIPS